MVLFVTSIKELINNLLWIPLDALFKKKPTSSILPSSPVHIPSFSFRLYLNTVDQSILILVLMFESND